MHGIIEGGGSTRAEGVSYYKTKIYITVCQIEHSDNIPNIRERVHVLGSCEDFVVWSRDGVEVKFKLSEN